MALSISVSASVQSAPPVTGTAATSLRPNSRTFSLTGTMGTTIVSGDIVAMWGSNDGGRTYQPLRTAAGQQVLLTFGNPECVINDCCDHYATQRVGVGTGSALVAVGLNGEGVYVNPSPAWVQGGNSGFAPVGILGTTDAVPFRIIAEGIDIFDSDGSTTALGNTETLVPGNSLQLSAGAGGGQFAVTGAGTLDLQTDSGILSIDSTGGAINVGTGAQAKTVTIGNGAGATAVTIDVGTGDLSLGTDLTVHDVNIGSSAGASSVAINGGTGGVGLGSNPIAQTVVIGNSTGATAVNINGGTGGFSVSTAGAISVGVNPVAQTITIGNSTGATSVAINGGTGAMSFGANAIAHSVTIGSVTGAAATSIQAGTGGLAIVNNGATWTWPSTLGAAGTKLTDAAGNGVLSFA